MELVPAVLGCRFYCGAIICKYQAVAAPNFGARDSLSSEFSAERAIEASGC